MKFLYTRKIKIIGLSLFLFFLLGGLSLLAVFLIREHHRAANLEKAVQIFESGDYPLAKRLLRQVIVNDPNQEQAYVCLAKIARIEGNWQREADYWHTAQLLNTLIQEYRQKFKKALRWIRNYDKLMRSFFNAAELQKPCPMRIPICIFLAAGTRALPASVLPKMLETRKS